MSDSSTTDNDIVYALAASPDFAEDGVCFAARHSGLWRSDQRGERWQPVTDLPGASVGLPVTAVALSPNFQSDGRVFAGVRGSVLLSTDSGTTWKGVALPSPPPLISALAVSPDYENDGIVFAATLEDGVFRSHDGGVTWQAWNFGLFDLSVLSIAASPTFARDRTVFVGTETGLFCSKNGGRAWRETGFPTDFAPVLSLAVSPQSSREGSLFAGTEASGLMYSDDQGQSWRRLLDSEAINTILLAPDFPGTADVLAVSNDTVWLSHDGGQSWSNRNPDANLSAGLTTAAVPSGFAQEQPLLLGVADGQILWA
jgi:photosystem II stability/assembly factor-like uncharacterized protein